MRHITQIVYGVGNVAAPITLLHYMKLVVVQCRSLAREPADMLTHKRHDTQKTYRGLYPQEQANAQFTVQQVAERARRIDIAVAEKVSPTVSASLKSKKHSLHNIEDIDKCKVLRPVANGKVDMTAYALCHHEIVALARTVHSRGAQYHVWECISFSVVSKNSVETALALHLTASIGSVGTLRIRRFYFTKRLVLMHRTIAAQTAYIHKTPDIAAKMQQGFHQIDSAKSVDTVEVGTVHTFSNAGGMDHIVERQSGKAAFYVGRTAEIKFYEVYPRIG